MSKLVKIIVYFLLICGLIFVSGKLFFPKTLSLIFSYSMSFVSKPIPDDDSSLLLRVVYPDAPTSIEPTSLSISVRNRLFNILEPLVKTDPNSSLRPGLALSWGRIDDNTWEFILRKNVFFHDNSEFTVEDVKATFNRVKNFPQSELSDYLKTVKEVKVIDSHNFQIITEVPDPLLISKLSLVAIIPSRYEQVENFDGIVGTGPYKFYKYLQNGDLILEKNGNYWGDEPRFDKVQLISKEDSLERVNSLLNLESDFLYFVPQDAVPIVQRRGYKTVNIPSLEVQFLVFNFNSPLGSSVDFRKAVSLGFDKNGLVRFLGEFVFPVNQFVSNGVFGYNPGISPYAYNLDSANLLIQKLGITGDFVKIYLPSHASMVGEHLKTQLRKMGLYTQISYFDNAEYLEAVKKDNPDIFFLGFKSDLGDSVQFLEHFAVSSGDLNFGKYSNPSVDDLINDSFSQMDPRVRLDNIQNVMRILVEEDYFGIPLFQYETIFAHSSLYKFFPRIDGLLLFDELSL